MLAWCGCSQEHKQVCLQCVSHPADFRCQLCAKPGQGLQLSQCKSGGPLRFPGVTLLITSRFAAHSPLISFLLHEFFACHLLGPLKPKRDQIISMQQRSAWHSTATDASFALNIAHGGSTQALAVTHVRSCRSAVPPSILEMVVFRNSSS